MNKSSKINIDDYNDTMIQIMMQAIITTITKQAITSITTTITKQAITTMTSIT